MVAIELPSTTAVAEDILESCIAKALAAKVGKLLPRRMPKRPTLSKKSTKIALRIDKSDQISPGAEAIGLISPTPGSPRPSRAAR